MDIPVIPNKYLPEGVITCGPETSAKMKAEFDRLSAELLQVKGERDQAMERIEDAIQKFDLMSKGRYTHWEKSQIARRISESLSDFIARAALHPATEETK